MPRSLTLTCYESVPGLSQSMLCTNLGKGSWVDSVLGSDFDTSRLVALSIISSLDTSFNEWIDTLVQAGVINTQVVGGSNSHAVDWSSIGEGSSVAGQSSLLDIEASLTTDKETLVGDNTVNDSIDVASSRSEFGKSASMECALLEEQSSLLGLEARLGVERTGIFSLDTSSEDILELNLGVEGAGRGPGSGGRDT